MPCMSKFFSGIILNRQQYGRVVHRNLSSALIFEDDVDWDIRLRQQLSAFARASSLLTEHLDPSLYLVREVPNPETPELSIHNGSSLNPISSKIYSINLSTISKTIPLSSSPYGNPANWDILWLGHCGAGFPRPPQSMGLSSANVVLTNPDDPTVPLPKYLRAHPFGPLDALAESHPVHTRVYHRASGGALCTVAYAVSQRGARKLLYEFGVRSWSRIWDVELGDWCARSRSSGQGGNDNICVTVQPPIFAHHHPPGGESDIGGLGGGYARTVETKYLRKSVRMNLEALVRGEHEETLVDQWPD